MTRRRAWTVAASLPHRRHGIACLFARLVVVLLVACLASLPGHSPRPAPVAAAPLAAPQVRLAPSAAFGLTGSAVEFSPTSHGLGTAQRAVAQGDCDTSVSATLVNGTLQMVGTDGQDQLRARIDVTAGALEVFDPATSSTSNWSFDLDLVQRIDARLCDGDDLLVMDDSGGSIADRWSIRVMGDGGDDTVLGGLDGLSIADALQLIETVQRTHALVDDAIELLGESTGACDAVPCLVSATAGLTRSASEELVLPAAHYLRDIEPNLVRPAAETVRDAHGRIAVDLTGFVSETVQSMAGAGQEMQAEVEVAVDEIELLLPTARQLLTDTRSLHAQAANLGLEVQSRDAVLAFTRTIESHVASIASLSRECDEEPDDDVDPETNEDLQDPSGLPPGCAELERRIEALEAIADQVGEDEDENSSVSRLEAEARDFEARGDALALEGEALGDDQLSGTRATDLVERGRSLVGDADAFHDAAENMAQDWESWTRTRAATLESAGEAMHDRGLNEIQGGGSALREQATTEVGAAAERLQARADQIRAELESLMLVAAPLMGGGVDVLRTTSLAATTCSIAPDNTISGGSGGDVLIGTGQSDEIDGGADGDLLLGAGGDDLVKGGEGRDVLIGGEDNDQLEGGEGTDVLVGGSGEDCLYGGGGEDISLSNSSVDLGDLFFGGEDGDLIAIGDGTDDGPAEVDIAWGGEGDDTIQLGHGGELTVGSLSIQFGNLVFGQDGKDEIETGDGIDVVFGGAAADTIETGRGADLELPGGGSSTLRVDLGDLIFGEGEDDTIDADDPDADRDDDDVDVIFAGDGADTVRGFGGGRISIGGSSIPAVELHLGNLVFGGMGEDDIETQDGVDVVFGEEDGDTIQTGRGHELDISGSDGDSSFRLAIGDLIFGGSGEDTLHGDDPDADREDDDIDVVFAGADGDIVRGYGGGMLSIGSFADPALELMLGNLIVGGTGADDIETLAGIDVVFAGEDGDEIAAGRGDELELGDAFEIDFGDLLFGQEGDDVLHGDAADPPSEDESDGIDIMFGGDGSDKLYGGTGGRVSLTSQSFCLLFGNLLFGGSGNDLLRGDYESWDADDPRGGIDLAFGGDGADTIEGGGGSLVAIGSISTLQAVVIWFGNLLLGGHGNDTIRGGDSSDISSCANTELTELLTDLNVTDFGGAADFIFGGDGNDEIDGYDGIDIAFGSHGDDKVRAADGGIMLVPISGIPVPIPFGNVMFGSGGADEVISQGRLVLPEIDLLFGGPCDDVIETGDGFNLAFGGRDDDDITAGDGFNLLFGNREDDSILTGSGLNVAFGNKGDDTVMGGEATGGVYVMFGNDGNDAVRGGHGLTIAFGNGEDDLVESGAGLNVLFGNGGHDEVTSGDGLTVAFGNRGHDDVRSDDGLAVLFGNRGNDDVRCDVGVCVAFGNRDHDLVGAGAGLNVLFGNDGEDRVTAGSGLNVQFGNKGDDIISAGAGVLLAFGGASSDAIVGGTGLNIAFGNADDDHYLGGAGRSLFFGNDGKDQAVGGDDGDVFFGNRADDTMFVADGRDIVFGNRGNDTLGSGDWRDMLFGNRGNDRVRADDTASNAHCDRLFGNRGNDTLDRCHSCDRRLGGRGSDTKTQACAAVRPSSPKRGEVRGRVMIDEDGDMIGDVGHEGVTVTAGSGSLSDVTDEEGWYRIVGLGEGGTSVGQSVPAGYAQISTPIDHSVTVGSQELDLFEERDFVNQATCAVAPDGWGCVSAGCKSGPADVAPGCHPVAVRMVRRCSSSGARCADASDCPCGVCEPSWEVVRCECRNIEPGCAIVLDPMTGPSCIGTCPAGGSRPCTLQREGDVFTCGCGSKRAIYLPIAVTVAQVADSASLLTPKATPTAATSLTVHATWPGLTVATEAPSRVASKSEHHGLVHTRGNPSSHADDAAMPAQAVEVDGSWIVLDELMPEGSFFAPLFHYTSTVPVRIDVTDLYVISDRSEVFLDGVSVGTSPAVPDWTELGSDPLGAPFTEDPGLAWAEPAYSKASFVLPSGSHVVTLRNVHVPPKASGAPYPDGTVAFRLRADICLPPGPLGGGDLSLTPGHAVALPALSRMGVDDVCDTRVHAQNVGSVGTHAILVTWGDTTDCAGAGAPVGVSCSGLIGPGSAWSFDGPNVPAGSLSGIVYAFAAGDHQGNPIVTTVCNHLTGMTTAAEYETFHAGYLGGGTVAGIPMTAARGEALAVAAYRSCPGDVTPGVEVASSYEGISDAMLETPASTSPLEYAYRIPLVIGDQAGFISHLYLQNFGSACAQVQVAFREQGTCLPAQACTLPSSEIPVGQTLSIEAPDCVGLDWQGDVEITSNVPLAVASDLVGRDTLSTYRGISAVPSQGADDLIGPLMYQPGTGWSSWVQVQNLGCKEAEARVTFHDDTGAIVSTLSGTLCPNASESFVLPVSDDTPAVEVGWIRVESRADSVPQAQPLAAVAWLQKFNDVQGTEVQEASAYNLLPVRELSTGDVGLPFAFKDLLGSGLTSEVQLTAGPQFGAGSSGTETIARTFLDPGGTVDSDTVPLAVGTSSYEVLRDLGIVPSALRGSVLLSDTGTRARFSAAGVIRLRTGLGADIPGDESATYIGLPIGARVDGGIVAQFVSNEMIHEDGGESDGWHRVGAPVPR